MTGFKMFRYLAVITALFMPLSAAALEQESCHVASIHDGDTLRVDCPSGRHQIRLYCIDAPELAQAPHGVEARDSLRALAGEEVVILPRARDRYGREVAEVIGSWGNAGLGMVAAGSAATYPKYCRDQAYHGAEKAAKVSKVGIWKEEGLQQTPWAYRKAQKSVTSSSSSH